jgi:hypothetical protein
MAATILFSSRRYLITLLAGALGCASGDLLLPDPPGGGENVQLAKFDGDLQEGTVGEQLPKLLVVQILTPRQQPATGRRVAFVVTSSAGEVNPDTAISDSQGLATTRAFLGTAPGDYVIEARLVADNPQTESFTAKAGPAAPDTLSPQSPLSQPGRREQVVATAPLVRVVDRFGNAVPDVPVAWQVTAGEGQTVEPITRTGVDGTATVQWRLGSRIGVHKLVATIEHASSSSATFTATVLF